MIRNENIGEQSTCAGTAATATATISWTERIRMMKSSSPITMLLNNGGGGSGSACRSSDRISGTASTLSSSSSSSSSLAAPSVNTIVVICLYVLIHMYYVRFLPTSASSPPPESKGRSGGSSRRRKGSSSKFLLPRGGGDPRRRRTERHGDLVHHHHHRRTRGGSIGSVDDDDDDEDGMTASTGIIDDDSDDNDESESESESEYSWMDDKEQELEIQVPDSTMMERRRFLIARKGNVDKAATTLQSYLDWQKEHHILTTTKTTTDDNTKSQRTYNDSNNDFFVRPTHDRDYDLWVEACLLAMKASDEKVKNIVLPRVIRSYGRKQQQQQQQEVHEHPPKHTQPSKDQGVEDHDGHRILHIIPGLMDDRLAKTSTYALATAIFIDKLFDRNDDEKLTVCLDVRAGKGWRNLHVLKLVPFIKDSLRLLLQLFPERLHKCIVYPIPPAFYYLWTMIAKCIDPKTRDKIVIVTGKCTIDAPPPAEQLAVQLGEDTAPQLEQYRVSCFRA